jgi:hypothetical protein
MSDYRFCAKLYFAYRSVIAIESTVISNRNVFELDNLYIIRIFCLICVSWLGGTVNNPFGIISHSCTSQSDMTSVYVKLAMNVVKISAWCKAFIFFAFFPVIVIYMNLIGTRNSNFLILVFFTCTFQLFPIYLMDGVFHYEIFTTSHNIPA